ncbi:MAG: hypothetical protein C4518_03335 [Desulfobacteraceae bacterium]|nr:MAG: hypothetical protein C4518_03335 [Desulfobacteraceae bacterium]
MRCGPDPPGSVENGGKLFERENAKKSARCDKLYRHNQARHSKIAASFCPRHGNRKGQGVFRSARAGFFCYFALPAKEK